MPFLVKHIQVTYTQPYTFRPPFQMTSLIQTSSDLKTFLAPFLKTPPPLIALDTEFLRRTTYWPKLCLIQIEIEGERAAIDPLSSHLDLTSLWDLLSNPQSLKILHAASQDWEALGRLTPLTFSPVFDTQIASMCLAPHYMPSYQHLVETHLGQRLNKSMQTTNWATRPLSDAALSYALDDVRHLGALYKTLSQKLSQKNRLAWLQEEQSRPPQKTEHISLKGLMHHKHTPQSFTILSKLALWREASAKQKNMPRGRILKDDQLSKFALHISLPETQKRLKKILGPQESKKILEIQRWPDEECLAMPSAHILSSAQKKKLGALKKHCTKVAEAHQIPVAFLITTRELETFIRTQKYAKRLIGWRKDLLNLDNFNASSLSYS